MRGSEEKLFRKRLLAFLLCALMTCQSFLPAFGDHVFASELWEGASKPLPEAVSEQIGPAEEPAEKAEASEEKAAPEEEEPAGEAENGEYPDPARGTVDSGNLTDFFTPEEIAQAEAFYESLETKAEDDPSETMLQAEEAERNLERAESEKYFIDDSSKFEADPGSEGTEGEEAIGRHAIAHLGTKSVVDGVPVDVFDIEHGVLLVDDVPEIVESAGGSGLGLVHESLLTAGE